MSSAKGEGEKGRKEEAASAYSLGRPGKKRINPLHDRSGTANAGETTATVKAYVNRDFLFSPAARPLRILCEYEEPRRRLDAFDVHNTIVFFGSARIHSRDATQQALAEAKSALQKSPEDPTCKAAVQKFEGQMRLADYYEKVRDLSKRLAHWSAEKEGKKYHVMTGGGPGMMEAANRGAHDAGADNLGLGISLPFELGVNKYVPEHLAFEFHYFFTRKYWLLYFCRALIIAPGGFGTLDELFETLTLLQTKKIKKKVPIVLFGASYWKQVINFQAMADHGVISPADIDLMYMTDDTEDAFNYIKKQLIDTEWQGSGPHSVFADVDSAYQNVYEDERAQKKQKPGNE